MTVPVYHKKTKTQYLIDGRLKEWGSGGRDAKAHKATLRELQLQEVKASQITQQTIERPLRTVTVRYLAKSYIEDQKVWNKDRDALIDNIVRKNKQSVKTSNEDPITASPVSLARPIP